MNKEFKLIDSWLLVAEVVLVNTSCYYEETMHKLLQKK